MKLSRSGLVQLIAAHMSSIPTIQTSIAFFILASLVPIFQSSFMNSRCFTATGDTSSSPILSGLSKLYSFTLIVSIESLASSSILGFLILIYLVLQCILQLVSLFFASNNSNNNIITKSSCILSATHSLNHLFESVLIIPIIIWIWAKKAPICEYISNNAESSRSMVVIQRPSDLAWVCAVVLFSMTLVLLQLINIMAAPCRSYYHNVILSASPFYSPLKLAFTCLIWLFSELALHKGLSILILDVTCCLYGVGLSFLNLQGLGRRHPASRKLEGAFGTLYFTHSLIYLVLHQLEGRKASLAMNALYFSALIFMAKTYSNLFDSHLAITVAGIDNTRHKKTLNSRKEGYLVDRYVIYRHKLKNDNQRTMDLDFGIQLHVYLLAHRQTCRDPACSCHKYNKVFNHDVDIGQSDYSSQSCQERDILDSFIESRLVKMLEQNIQNRVKSYILYQLLVYQAFELDDHTKALLTLARYYNKVRGSTMFFDALWIVLESDFTSNLSPFNLMRYRTSFSDAIEFDETYTNIVSQLSSLEEKYSAFYRHLADAAVVRLSSIYASGWSLINDVDKAQKSILRLSELNTQSSKAPELELHLRQRVLEEDSLYTSQLRARVLSLNKRAAAAIKKPQKDRKSHHAIDHLDPKTIIFALDIIDHPGLIKSYTSTFLSTFGYSREFMSSHDLYFHMIVPHNLADMARFYIADVSKNTRNFFEFTTDSTYPVHFYTSRDGYLLPFYADYKIELSQLQLSYVGVLKPASSSSSSSIGYILTDPAGKMISMTKDVQEKLEFESIKEVVGLNICLVIPDFLECLIDGTSFSGSERLIYTEEGKTSMMSMLAYQTYKAIKQSDVVGDTKARVRRIEAGLDVLNHSSAKDESRIDYESVSAEVKALVQDASSDGANCFELRLRAIRIAFAEAGVMYHVVEVHHVRKSMHKGFDYSQVQHNNKHKLAQYTWDTSSANVPFVSDPETTPFCRPQTPQTDLTNQQQHHHDVSAIVKDDLQSQDNHNTHNSSIVDVHNSFIKKVTHNQQTNLKFRRKLINTKKTRSIVQRSTNSDVYEDGWQQMDARSSSPCKDQVRSSPLAKPHNAASSSSNSATTLTKDAVINKFKQSIHQKGLSRVIKKYIWVCILVISVTFIATVVEGVMGIYAISYLSDYKMQKSYAFLSLGALGNFELQMNMFTQNGLNSKATAARILTSINEYQHQIHQHLNSSTAGSLLKQFSQTKEYLSDNIYLNDGVVVGHQFNFIELLLLTEVQMFSIFTNVKKSILINVFQWPERYFKLNTMTIEKAMFAYGSFANRVITAKKDHQSSTSLMILVVACIATLFTVIALATTYYSIEKKREDMLSMFCRFTKSTLEAEADRLYNDDHNTKLVKVLGEKNIKAGEKKKDSRRLFTNYIAQRQSMVLTMALMIVCWCILAIPFIFIYNYVRASITSWTEVTDEMDSWNTLQSQFALLGSETTALLFYLFVPAEKERSWQALQARQTVLDETLEHLSDVMAKSGSLSGLDASRYESAIILNRVKDSSFCPFLNANDATVALCNETLSGLANRGIISTVRYLKDYSMKLCTAMYQSDDSWGAFIMVLFDPDFMPYLQMSNYTSTFLKVLSVVLHDDVAQRSQESKDRILKAVMTILIVYFVTMLISWNIFSRIMSSRLYQARRILLLLPNRLITANKYVLRFCTEEI